jgi:hypothetical protein
MHRLRCCRQWRTQGIPLDCQKSLHGGIAHGAAQRRRSSAHHGELKSHFHLMQVFGKRPFRHTAGNSTCAAEYRRSAESESWDSAVQCKCITLYLPLAPTLARTLPARPLTTPSHWTFTDDTPPFARAGFPDFARPLAISSDQL